MPGARLYAGDLTQGLAEPLCRQQYDFILSTYALHHLPEKRQVSFLYTLRDLLRPEGKLLLGNVAFETRARLEACRQAAGDGWDAAECCFVVQELKEPSPTWFSGRSPSVPAC